MPQLEFVLRRTRRQHAPSMPGTFGLLVLVLLLALLLGYFCAVFPASFMSKVAVLILGAVVIVWAFAATRAAESPHAGRTTRGLINAWVLLMGIVPAYLPFKFGPLPGLNPLRVIFAGILIASVYGIVTSHQLRARLLAAIATAKWVFGFFAGLLVWQFVCAMVGDQPVFSLYYLAKVLLPAFVMYLVGMTFYRDWQDIQRTAAFLVVGVLFTCLAGAIEWRTQTNVFLRFFPADIDDLAGLGWILTEKIRGGDYRVSATFSHPLSLAEYLCMTLPFAAVLGFNAQRRWMRGLAWCVLPVLLGMIYLAHTRSSLIAAAASLIGMGLVFGLRIGRQRRNPTQAILGWALVVALVGVIVALSGSVAYLTKGRTEAETGSSQARVTMFTRAQTLLAEQPVQGYGPGLGAIKIGRIQLGQRSPTIDSYFLSTLIENGFVGLGMFVLGMTVLLWQTVTTAVRSRGAGSWMLIALSAAIFASLIVKLVLSLTDNLDLLYLFTGMAVVGLMLSRQAAVQPEPASATPRKASGRRGQFAATGLQSPLSDG